MTPDREEFIELELAGASRGVGDQIPFAHPLDKERNADELAYRIRQDSSMEDLFRERRISFFVLLKVEYHAHKTDIRRFTQSLTPRS